MNWKWLADYIPRVIVYLAFLIFAFIAFFYLVWPGRELAVFGRRIGPADIASLSAMRLLSRNSVEGSDLDPRFPLQIDEAGLLIATATTTGKFFGAELTDREARTSITVNGIICSANFVALPGGSSMTFTSSATCTKILEPGSYNLIAELSSLATQDNLLSFDYIVIPILQ